MHWKKKKFENFTEDDDPSYTNYTTPVWVELNLFLCSHTYTKKIQTDFKEIAVEDLKETRVLKLSFE